MCKPNMGLLERLRKIKKRLFKRKLSLQICILIALFGSGSWIAVNGLWVELPIIVKHAPEQWSLPSYLTVIISLANIGPVVYTLGNKFSPRFFRETLSIHILIVLGAFVLALLGILWKETSYIGGSKYSSALLSLSFFVAVVNCTSSVTFLPFIGKFKKEYIAVFFAGQGLSGLLPSLVALIQGAGSSMSCCYGSNKGLVKPTGNTSTITGNVMSTVLSTGAVKPTRNTSAFTGNISTILLSTTTIPPTQNKSLNILASYICSVGSTPLFSVDGFFYFLCAMMIICELAFLGLNFLPIAKQEQASDHTSPTSEKSKHIDEQKPLEHRESELNDLHDHEPNELQELQLTKLEKDSQSSLVSDNVYAETVEDTNASPTLSMRSILIVLFINATVNGFMNGVIPSVLSYATLPYGNKEYHLTLTLSAIVNPIACTLFYWITLQSLRWIIAWTAVYLGLSAYVVAIAAESPCPILNDSSVGGVIVVSLNKFLYF